LATRKSSSSAIGMDLDDLIEIGCVRGRHSRENHAVVAAVQIYDVNFRCFLRSPNYFAPEVVSGPSGATMAAYLSKSRRSEGFAQ